MARETTKIQIEPKILRSLRESSGYSIEDIAKKIKMAPHELEKAESTQLPLTLMQIKKLADIYHRPLASFFTDKPPRIPVVPDHRINRDKRLTPEVFLAERRAYYLVSKILEISDKRSKIPNYPESLNAIELSREFRNYLNIELIKYKKPTEFLSYYKEVIERNLLVLIIEYPIKAEDVRAFSIFSDLSVIVLNEDDHPKIKLFSLFHEICHLLKKTSGICSIEMDEQNQGIESFCNLFSAEFLVPAEDIRKELSNLVIDSESISRLSDIYGVSKQVVMLRLLSLGYIDLPTYRKFKEGYEEKLIKGRGGFRRKNWVKIFLNRVGNLTIQEVTNAYKKGDITFYEASNILNLKPKYVEKFIG